MGNSSQQYPKLAVVAGSAGGTSSLDWTRKGNGSGGGGPPVDTETKNYLDAKVDAVRAQNDARFAQVLARLDAMNPATWWQNAVVAATAVVALIGILLTVLSFASDRFDSGVSAMGAIEEQLDAQRETNAAQDERLDRVISALETIHAQPQSGATEEQP